MTTAYIAAVFSSVKLFLLIKFFLLELFIVPLELFVVKIIVLLMAVCLFAFCFFICEVEIRGVVNEIFLMLFGCIIVLLFIGGRLMFFLILC